jgi:hypothetical protein
MAPSSERVKLAKIALRMKRGEVSKDSNPRAYKMMREMATDDLRRLAEGVEERDYKEEYRRYHGKPEHIKERSERNSARRELGLKKGDGREVDHKKPLSKGGSNSRENLRVTSRDANRKKYNK